MFSSQLDISRNRLASVLCSVNYFNFWVVACLVGNQTACSFRSAAQMTVVSFQRKISLNDRGSNKLRNYHKRLTMSIIALTGSQED